MAGTLDKLGWIAEMCVLQLNGLSKYITPLPVQARKRLKVTTVLACSGYTNLASLMKCFSWTFQWYHRDKSLDDWNSVIVFLTYSYYSLLNLLFSFAVKTNLKLFSAFQIQIWRSPTVASKDFNRNCAAQLWDNLKILVVLPCLFILGWQKIAGKKVVHAWLENSHTWLQWISLRHYLRNSTYSFSPCTVFKQ